MFHLICFYSRRFFIFRWFLRNLKKFRRNYGISYSTIFQFIDFFEKISLSK